MCDQLLPEAPELTTGQLCERVKKLAIALDPDWARRRYEEAVRERKVVGYRNEEVLRRRTQIRDRTCVHPGCRAPASGTDGDHTQDWADGGQTRDENIGSLCRHDHMLKHVGEWRVTQPAPGNFLWTSRLGRRYLVRPPLIIQPLPDPIPRHPSRAPSHHAAASDDGDDDEQDGEGDHPTWREPPAPEPTPVPPPEPDPAAEIPPF